MYITEMQNRLADFIWQKDIKHLARWQRGSISFLRIIYAVGSDLASGLISLRAAGLVYITLLSLVPLLAVSFSVLKGFGIHNQLEPLLLHLLIPLGNKGPEIANQIISFVDNIKVGALGTLGLVFLLLTVLSLVKKIETAFNYSWKIATTRSLIQRFSNYLSVILVGPVLIFTGIGITASVNNSTIVNDILMIEPFGSFILMIGKILPFFLMLIVFTFIYILVPNTRVKIKPALAGALTASLLWELASRIFTSFIASSTNYTAIYSSFAILIIFMLWIYATWLIVLTGASFAFYYQHPESTHNRQQDIPVSCRLREKLAITIMQIISYQFHHQQLPLSTLQLSRTLDISEPLILSVVHALETAELLVKIEKGKNTYIPARSLETIRIDSVFSAIRKAEESAHLHLDTITADKKVDEIINRINHSRKKELGDITIKDII